MSFDTGQVPLMEADWSLGNKGLFIGAVAGSYFYIFDISVLRYSLYSSTLSQNSGLVLAGSILMGESNAVVSAYTMYRHLQYLVGWMYGV